MFFDARAAKLLQPGEHLVVDGCPGLRLEASATRKSWTYRYKAPGTGRMKQIGIGQWPAMAVQPAAAEWAKLRAQRGEGIDPGQLRREARQAVKVAAQDPALYQVQALVADYLQGHVDQHRQTRGAKATRRRLEVLLEAEAEFAGTPAASITRAQAFDILDRRKDRPTSTAKIRSELGAAWDYALDAGRLDGNVPNWWRMIMKGRLKSKGKLLGGKHVGQKRRTLPAAEIGQLLAWLPNMHEWARDACEMYLWTCARGVEIFGMRPEHVAEEKDGLWWTVPKALTKNARYEDAVDLRVPLVGRAKKIVQRRLKAVGPSGWLFADEDGEQLLQHRLSTYIYDLQPYSFKAQRRQGDGLVLPVTGWSPHHLRRAGRTLLASLGCIKEVGEAILGHMPAEIEGIYNEYTYDKERRLWLGKLSAELERLAKVA